MTKERIIHPPIKRSFDAIGHVALTDQIGSSMERFQDQEGNLYDHSSFMGTEDMRGIAQYCENAHSSQTEYDSIWDRAKNLAIEDTAHYCKRYLESANTNPPSATKYIHEIKKAYLRNSLRTAVRTAILMYGIERHDGTVEDMLFDEVDTVFLSREWPIIDILAELQTEAESSGLVICDEQSTAVTSVADIIKGRQGEIEQWLYTDMLSSIGDTKDINDLTASIVQNHMTVRYAEHIAPEQYDALLSKILDCDNCRTLQVLSSALQTFPRNYLRTLYDRDDEIATQFRAVLERTQSSTVRLELQPFHYYFPGGVTGEAAKSHPTVGPFLTNNKTDSENLRDALPIDWDRQEPAKRRLPHEIDSFNREVRLIVRDTCVSLFGEQAGLRYAIDVMRSFEPRKFLDADRPVYDILAVSKNLRRIESFVNKFGAETIMQLHAKFDLAAIDIISHGDIKKLKGLMENDPEIIDKLKKQDITLVAFDAYGDYNDATHNLVTMFNTTSPRRSRIVAPWRDPSDFYRMLAVLKSRGLKFSTLAVAAHGGPSSITLNKDDEKLIITSEALPENLSYVNRDYQESAKVDIAGSPIRRIARDYMELPKYAEEVGLPAKKRIVYLACSSDVGLENSLPSVAEATLKTIHDADSIVIGGENITASNPQRKYKNSLYLFGPQRGEAWDSTKNDYESNLVTLTTDPATWTVIRTPHPEGVIA